MSTLGIYCRTNPKAGMLIEGNTLSIASGGPSYGIAVHEAAAHPDTRVRRLLPRISPFFGSL